MKRVTLIVLDSLGIGELADAESYGDKGADTLGHIADHMESFHIPNLKKLGFGNIQGAAGGRFAVESPAGAFGKLKEKSKGKDTITGHWEIAGLYTEIPFKTYPDGFPAKFMKAYEQAIGMETLGNYAASGTEIIEELGPEHEATGKPIVYTSADSVFQIAANTAVIPLEKLYEICETARKMLVGDVACGRVIARPYIIDENGKRVRTSERRDYAVSPSGKTVLDKVEATGKTVYAVGKISDIFNGKGVTESVHTESNMDGVNKTIDALNQNFEGFIFTNLVDFDSKFGHRRDPIGYGKAIEEFDARLPEIISAMGEEDILMLCADHGNDPVHSGWDHTREHIPVVIYGKEIKAGVDLGVRESFADIGATICDMLGAEKTEIGESFLSLIKA
ncbi:phosphopentomutase [Aminipila luticellarii]|uniref:Phosphopentomutase n=1 Tax=Aminipila luticellarii TaxID=2507160 RepID=A0A410PVP9_9FIRM|nr:phosphopentomutase [Aminipila luticellarii]QAT43019.1 phosphopentomutase [Aminipila luticellarii]